MSDNSSDNSDAAATAGQDESDSGLFDRASKAGSGLSLVLGACVVFCMVMIYRFQPKLFKRVSLRLVLVGTCCDMVYAFGVLLSALPTGYDQDPLCAASMFIQLVFLLGSLFCTASIGLNLLIVFVLKVRSDRPFEKIYYSTSAFVSAVVPLIALCAGRFGFDGTECWYSIIHDSPESERLAFTWQWITYYGWVLLVCTFCLGCTILFHFSVARVAHPAANNATGTNIHEATNKAFKNTDRLIGRAVDRIRWYCIVPILAHIWSLVCDTQAYVTGNQPTWLWATANFMSGAMGALNSLIFFCLDPSFHMATSRLRVYLVYRHYLRHFTLATPMNSSSRSVVASHDDSHQAPENSAGGRFLGTMSLRQHNNDAAAAESGKANFEAHLVPRRKIRKTFMFHFVRFFLLRERDKERMLKTAQMNAKVGAQQKDKIERSTLLRLPTTTGSYPGGSSMGAERAIIALDGTKHADEDAAEDELNRL
ncbi:hypothetical protein HDU87_005600 [Geranomyces variabilis]|uniref:G-protein coupled receptors family 2 profile 2 domain-containing protein n=1 Tax=Geranomyces variabilis TaxID=109894 RepID=A0AAD5THQ5_9FUNG|nr:hypothetical protein HDU87_005600 [Geranomyces variabilis]